jgi:hypothetical protein
VKEASGRQSRIFRIFRTQFAPFRGIYQVLKKIHPNQKISIMTVQIPKFTLVLITQFFFLYNIFAQSQMAGKEIEEPVFIIRVEQIGQSDGISYSSVLEKIYAPCSNWTGGSGGFSGTPAGFIINAGGLGGLKPKMAVPFYARGYSGTAQGSDGSKAKVVTAGDGLGLWTEQLGDDECTKLDDPAYQPSRHMSARFERTETGARITFDAGIVSAGCATYIGFISLNQMEVDPKLIQQFCTFELSNEELKNWNQLKKTHTQNFIDDNGKLTVKASLLYLKTEEDAEVKVEIEGYEKWIPEANIKNPEKPGNKLKIKATVLAKDGDSKNQDAIITFSLNNVSKEPGVCINGPAAVGWDLAFTKEENAEATFNISPLEIKTKQYVSETQVVVSSFDFGAFAELSVKAVDRNNKSLKVSVQFKERSSVTIPKAELGGKIADAWREKEAVEGLSDDWDAEMVKGQPVNGDGLSLYEEYRGALVGRTEEGVYSRLSPKEKELFVVDDAGILDAELWKSVSGIASIFVSNKNTKGAGVAARELNWCSDYAKVGSKHAVVIDTKTKTVEQFVMGEVNEGVSTPRDVTFCHVYPKTALDFVNELTHKLQIAIKNPESEQAAYFIASGLPPKLWKDALDRLGPETIEKLVTLQIKWTAIHELGHACGIKGHLSKGEPQKETSLGHPQCFMRYTKSQEDAMHFLLQILFPDAKTNMDFTLFCTDGYNCMGALNVKDR